MEFSIRLVPLAKLFFCTALLSTCLLNAEDLQQSVDVDSAQLAGEFAAFIEQADLMRTETARELDQTRQEIVACEVENRDWNWRLLPDGLIWHSYMAAPHEPRISTLIFYDQNDGVYWDATLGGRVGLLRYGTKGPRHPSGWQWDLEGAVITRLDLLTPKTSSRWTIGLEPKSQREKVRGPRSLVTSTSARTLATSIKFVIRYFNVSTT